MNFYSDLRSMKNLFTSLLVFSSMYVCAQTIPASKALENVGKNVTVCSDVKSTYFNSKSNMTYLNLGAAYPNQELTVVIFADDLKKFSEAPATLFANKNVCVTGTVKLYKEKPEIILTDPKDIEVK